MNKIIKTFLIIASLLIAFVAIFFMWDYIRYSYETSKENQELEDFYTTINNEKEKLEETYKNDFDGGATSTDKN